MIRSFRKTLCLIAGLSFSTLVAAQLQQIDKIVAIVDSGVILQSQVDNRTASIRARFEQSGTALPPQEVLEEQIIDRLILEEIQMQLAARGGVRISDAEINAAFQNLAINAGMSPSEFIAALNAEGGSISMILRDLRMELTLQRLQQAQVNQRIFITDSELDNFLNSAEGQYWQAPDFNLQHIMIGLASNAGPDEIRVAEDLANNLQQQLENGADFGSLAAQYSVSPTALEGGQIGWRKPIEFADEIGDVIAETEVGGVTPAIRSAGGIHLFKVNEMRDNSDAQMIEQVKTRHILVMPSEIRSDEEARQTVETLRNEIIAGDITFEEAARKNSEDFSNALKGGDLGWVLPGQMVPEFETMMYNTPVGEISPVVRTQYGWHILKVDERKDVDMSNDILRQQTRNLLRSQRFEEELDLWLREIRADAFVQILSEVEPMEVTEERPPGGGRQGGGGRGGERPDGPPRDNDR